jgi:Na+/glutamate symporter
MAQSGGPPRLRQYVVARARLVGSGLVVGLVLGGFGMAGWTLYTGDARASEATVLALGALVFGFGLLGWSGPILAGRGIEAMQEQVGTRSDWTERDSRRAMARLCGGGGGIMIGTSVVAALL